ncbi:hypothetical protein M3175_03255 [Robertmurraya korlensis]|uniref:hypothetical protein n=1 Tax=Robertmurraya korlensis TaxID=519977 RepID=UPI00203C6C7E|nr:hypothetical protein [Robertmurraya korlensis]MCM3599735.1 hypothetical protein [Robertmurraya korlensis]
MKKISDEQLEEWLREMPKLKDHRDPHDIYENISKKLEERPRKTWIIPSFATAAAVLLVAILSFNLFDGASVNHSADKSLKEEAAIEQKTSLQKEESSVENEARTDVGNEENSTEMNDITFQATEDSTTAVYAEDLGAMQVFTLAIPDSEGQNIIPVSLLVETTDLSDKLSRLEEAMASMDEEEWGLGDYYPLEADLAVDEASSTLNVDVFANHPYQFGSTTQVIFENAIQQLLNSLQLNQAIFTTNKIEKGITLSNDVLTSITKTEPRNRPFYLFYTNDIPYLVPYSESYSTIEEAFEAMKTNIDTHNLRAPLLVDQISEVAIDETNKSVVITFNKEINIEDTPETTQSIEAILLTVKSFGYEKVKFNNAPIDYVGRFALQEEIQVPIAANKKSID